jgi:hypothetical protein
MPGKSITVKSGSCGDDTVTWMYSLENPLSDPLLDEMIDAAAAKRSARSVVVKTGLDKSSS